MRSLRLSFLVLNRSVILPLGLVGLLGVAPRPLPAQPANDDFANAKVITGIFGSVTTDNTGATAEPGEPSHAGFPAKASIWYQWTAPQSGEVYMDTLGSSYLNNAGASNLLDTVLAIYTGTDLEHLTQVAANDDLFPDWEVKVKNLTTFSLGLFGELAYWAPFNGPSFLRFNATYGTTYYIAADTKNPTPPPQLFGPLKGYTASTNIPTGPITLSWAFASSGSFRFATEDIDVLTFLNTGVGTPLYQCAGPTSLSTVGGESTLDNESTFQTYYGYDPQGVLVTVTRTAGSAGRALVDYATRDDVAFSNIDYVGVSGTLIFDDYEMSKTITIPILNGFEAYTTDFYIDLSNPRLAPLESTNVAAPRLDPAFATAEVQILSELAITDDPQMLPCSAGTPPNHDVFNFLKVHYRVPRDVNSYWSTVVIWVYRTLIQNPNGDAATLNYRIDNYFEDGGNNPPSDGDNDYFPLSAGSDYATPDPPNLSDANRIHGTNSDFTAFAPNYGGAGGGTITFGGNTAAVPITFTVNNDFTTKLNKEFHITLSRGSSGCTGGSFTVSPGEVCEAWVTILYDDANAPAGSVDENYNADYGDSMAPNVATTPQNMAHPGTDDLVYSLAVQPADDKTIIAGQFISYDTFDRPGIARVNTDGGLDTTFDPGAGVDQFISSLSLLPSGQMMIGGAFSSYDNQPRTSVARVNADGTLDPSFDPGVPGIDGIVWAMAVQPNDGKIIIGGDFQNVGGVSRPYLARLDTNGILDFTFDPSTNAPNSTVNAIVITPDGHVVIGGAFTALGAQAITGLAELTTNGTLNGAFTAQAGSGPDSTVWSLALDSSRRVLAGGDFANFNLIPRPRIVRLNPNGSLDATFNPGTGADSTVFSISPQADGTIYVGGQFRNFNGTHRCGFTRLYANGTVDTTFMDTTYNQFAGLHKDYYDKQSLGDPLPFVRTIGVQTDTNIMIGGLFSQVGGGQASALNRVDPDFPTNLYNQYVWTEPKSRDGLRNRSNVARLLGGATPGPGNLGLLYTNYSINKSQGFISVALTRTNGLLGLASANFEVLPGLAQGGVDFQYYAKAPIYLSTWELDEFNATTGNATSRDHTDGLFGTNALPADMYGDYWFNYTPGVAFVSVLDDTAYAGNLNASLQVANPSGADSFFLGGENIPVGVALASSFAPLTIVDDNRKTNFLGFASATFTVNESGTNALITVVRTNGTAGACSVYVSATNGTARAGINYYGITNKLLNFGAGVTTQTFNVTVIDDHVVEANGLTVNLQLTGISGASYGQTNAVLNIIDNDGAPGIVNFSSATYGTNESAAALILTLTRSGGDTGTLSVQCTTTNGTAINGLNYIGFTNTVGWTNSLDFSPRYVAVPLLDNGLVGSNLTLLALLSNPLVNTTNDPAALGAIKTATIIITNDNRYGALQFSSPTYLVNENGGLATVTVTRTGGSAQELTVKYSTADGPNAYHTGPDPNYVPVSGTLAFNPGVVSTNFTIPILDDGVVDPPPSNFYFFVNLSSPNIPGALGSPATAQVQILDAETYNQPAGEPDTAFIPNPGFNGDVYSLALQTNGQILVGGNFTSANGAARGNLARLNADASLDANFLANASGANGPVNSVVVQTDGRVLVGGSFTSMNGVSRNYIARLAANGFLDTSFSQGSGADGSVMAIVETFVGLNREILLGGSFLNVNSQPHAGLVRLHNDASIDTTFDPNLSVNGTVYAIAVYPTNTVDAGKIVIGGNFKAVDGNPVGCIARLNPDGTLDTTFAPSGASNAVRALAIQYDGRIVVGGSFTNFNGKPLNHLARLNTDGSLDTSFNLGLGASDTVDSIALQSDSRIVLVGQFLQASGVSRNRITRLLPSGAVDPAINFGAAADSYIDTVVIQTNGMLVIGGGFSEFDGQTRPHLARLYGGNIAGSGSFNFTSGNFGADENSTNATITVRRVGGTAGNMSVTFSTSPITAVPGVNYSNVTATLQFPNGETFQNVLVPVKDDQQITPDLLVHLALSNPSPPSGLGVQPIANLTIFNDDSGISFSQPAYSVNQDVVGGVASIPVVRIGSVRTNATVFFFTTTNGTAGLGTNYLAVSNTVTFLTGVSNATVRVPILNNPLMLNDTTVGLELTNAENSLLFSPDLATLTILTTNRAAGEFTFSQTNYFVDESSGLAAVTVLRTNGHSGNVSVDFTTIDDTALAGYNYTATNGTLTFLDGETSQTIDVPILNPGQVTPTEDFFLTLSNATGGASLIPQGAQTIVTIIDDNHIGVHFLASPLLATNTYPIREDAGSVQLTLERVGTNGVTTVNFATSDGTAKANVNYVPASGTITFSNGETIKNFSIGVLHDTNVTGDLTFLVTLSNVEPPPAQLFNPSVAQIIVEDVDPGVSFTNANFYTSKSASNVVITVLNANPRAGTVSVNYTTITNGSTAVAGVDYVPTGGTLTFSNNNTLLSFTVPIINNQLVENNPAFYVALTNPTPANCALLYPSTASVVISNNLAGLSFDSSAYMVAENGGTKTINVIRTGYTNSTVSIDFTTEDGTGHSNVNYRATSGTLVFTNGVTNQSFVVTIEDDDIVNGDKTALLVLQNPVGNALRADPYEATLDMLESDGTLITAAGTALTYESGPVNGVIDPNETVSILFGLRAIAGSNTVNLTSTLLSTNGVVSSPGQSQSYGALTVHGPSASRPFTFTANGTNGQEITATFQVHDVVGPTNLVVFNFTLGTSLTTYSNTTTIVINDDTNATPYPSVINVGGILGQVSKVSATLTNFTHSWPRDVSVLLVSPSRSESFLMSKTGGSFGVTNVALTFDDAATHTLPNASAMVSGTYKPTSYAVVPPPFTDPAPPPPYNTNLSAFVGNNPNGAWSLFVIDDLTLNVGLISNGWFLNLTTTDIIPGDSDVGLAMLANNSTVVLSNNVQYTLLLTNYGPALASNVVVVDTLPNGCNFLGDTPSQGSVTTNGAGLVSWSVGNLAVNATASLTLIVQADVGGSITNSAALTTGSFDPNPDDSTASSVVNVVVPNADLAMIGLASIPNVLGPSGPLTYTLSITITNQGPATAPQTIIVATLTNAPLAVLNPSVNFVSSSALSNSVTAVPGGILVTNYIGNLLPGSQASISVVAQPTGAGQFLNAATCSSGVTDPAKANNSLPAVKTIVLSPPPPKVAASAAAGGNVVLHGSSGMPGWPCLVLSSTDPRAPLNTWTPVATNYFDASGNVTVTITNTARNVPARFYLLVEP